MRPFRKLPRDRANRKGPFRVRGANHRNSWHCRVLTERSPARAFCSFSLYSRISCFAPPPRKNTTPTCPCPQDRVVCILLVLLAEAIRTVHNGKQCGRSALISSSPALRVICTCSHNWSEFVEVLARQISLAPRPPFFIFSWTRKKSLENFFLNHKLHRPGSSLLLAYLQRSNVLSRVIPYTPIGAFTFYTVDSDSAHFYLSPSIRSIANYFPQSLLFLDPQIDSSMRPSKTMC